MRGPGGGPDHDYFIGLVLVKGCAVRGCFNTAIEFVTPILVAELVSNVGSLIRQHGGLNVANHRKLPSEREACVQNGVTGQCAWAFGGCIEAKVNGVSGIARRAVPADYLQHTNVLASCCRVNIGYDAANTKFSYYE